MKQVLRESPATQCQSGSLKVNLQRDNTDRLLVMVQILTLFFLMIYVGKTWAIASSTEQATVAATANNQLAAKVARMQVAISLIDQLYSDAMVQQTLERVFADNLEFRIESGNPIFTSNEAGMKKRVDTEVNITLNRMQILGQLYSLEVLKLNDLLGLRYEIISIGRNKAIRQYFGFLNHDYQNSSGIIHDHFAFLKELYVAFEYEQSYSKDFERYSFCYPEWLYKTHLELMPMVVNLPRSEPLILQTKPCTGDHYLGPRASSVNRH